MARKPKIVDGGEAELVDTAPRHRYRVLEAGRFKEGDVLELTDERARVVGEHGWRLTRLSDDEAVDVDRMVSEDDEAVVE